MYAVLSTLANISSPSLHPATYRARGKWHL